MVSCSSAPEATARRLDGAPFSTADLRGQPTWVEFVVPWDPASRRRLLDVADLLQRSPALAERLRPVVVGVRCSAKELREALPWSEKPPLLVVLDEGGAVADAYGVEAVPTTLVLDTEGRVRHLRTGYVEASALEEALGVQGPSR